MSFAFVERDILWLSINRKDEKRKKATTTMKEKKSMTKKNANEMNHRAWSSVRSWDLGGECHA